MLLNAKSQNPAEEVKYDTDQYVLCLLLVYNMST